MLFHCVAPLLMPGQVDPDHGRAGSEKSFTEVDGKLKLLFQTIKTLSYMIEVRDPYTYIHQERVSTLAAVIAFEMGFPAENIDTVRLAAAVHDIGKIRIPSEILNKPGKIDEYEFGMIQTHPQVGFDILHKIEFLEPVAEIVLQHHERLNGSGYPLGTKRDRILLESKILAVADVVEAMISHRPYRPALGVKAALKEISENRDVLYDPSVVDAWIRLSRKRDWDAWSG